MYQAFTSEYPVDLFDYVAKGAPYMPDWNWNGTYCEIGHDLIVKAYYVEDLQLDTVAEVAGRFSWTVKPVGLKPKLH